MLTPAQIEHIQELLRSDKHLSYRVIALRAGVSRRVVSQIARGQRPVNHRQEPAWNDPRYFDDNAKVGRCPDCGCRVALPCIACRAGRYRRLQQWGNGYHFGAVARGQCHALRQPA